MTTGHPLNHLLRLHDAGLLPAATVDALVEAHLSEVEARPLVLSGDAGKARHGYFTEALLAREPRHQAELQRALRDFRHLMRLGEPEAQRNAVANARSRYSSALLATKLLDHCREVIHEDPEEAENCARLAGVVAYRAEDLLLEPLSRAVLANAVRVRGNLEEADRLFAETRRLVLLAPSDPATRAECDSLEASLRRDQRRFDDARVLLERAAIVFATLGNRSAEARVRLKLAEVERFADAADLAVQEVKRCLALIDPRTAPKLHLVSLHALALNLLSAGRADTSAELLDVVRPLFARQASGLMALRLRWLEGRVAAARGELQAAEQELAAALAGFAARRLPLVAAVVAIDLAEVLLATGRPEVVRQFGSSLAQIFHGQRLEGETAQVIRLLWRAAMQDELTASVLQRLRHVAGQRFGP